MPRASPAAQPHDPFHAAGHSHCDQNAEQGFGRPTCALEMVAARLDLAPHRAGSIALAERGERRRLADAGSREVGHVRSCGPEGRERVGRPMERQLGVATSRQRRRGIFRSVEPARVTLGNLEGELGQRIVMVARLRLKRAEQPMKTDRGKTVARSRLAILFADAALRAGVRRYLVVSSMGANPEHEGSEVFDVYLRAKGEAGRLSNECRDPGCVQLPAEPGAEIQEDAAFVLGGLAETKDLDDILCRVTRQARRASAVQPRLERKRGKAGARDMARDDVRGGSRRLNEIVQELDPRAEDRRAMSRCDATHAAKEPRRRNLARAASLAFDL